MIKTNTRDYAVSAFMMYAKSDKIKSNTLKDLLRTARREYLDYTANEKHSKIKARKLRQNVSSIRRLFLDVYAVEKALYSKTDERSVLIAKTVEAVYFHLGKYGNKKGRISSLVTRCSFDLNISTTTVYKYLEEASESFCEHRGLRRDDDEVLKIISALKNPAKEKISCRV